MFSMRRMVQEAAWTSIMTLLAQARIEAKDPASTPPLVQAKRDQVVDILSLLEPFEEAMQVRDSCIEMEASDHPPSWQPSTPPL